MHARVSTYRFEAGRADEIGPAFEKSVGAVEELEGERGIYLLLDRDSGKAMTITLWEDEATVAASAEAANQIRSQAAEQSGITIESVETYEVALQQVS
jgi:heme-degrading monooxygenase HmoA